MRSATRPLPALLASALLLGATGTVAEEQSFEPRPFTAVYEGSYGVLSGRLTMRLEHLEDDQWQMTSTLAPRGVARGLARLLGRSELVEQARLRLNDEGVVPLHYEREDGISGPDRNATLEFRHEEGRLVGTDREEPVDLPLNGEILDRLTVQLQLMHDLTNNLRRREYSVVDRAEAREMDVTYIDGQPVVEAAGREFETLALDHQSRNSSRSTRLWTAREYQYLPVRIEQTRNGSTEWSGVLRNVDWGEPPAKPAEARSSD